MRTLFVPLEVRKAVWVSYTLLSAYLHLCKGIVTFEVTHGIDSQFQVRVVAFKIMWIVVGIVVG